MAFITLLKFAVASGALYLSKRWAYGIIKTASLSIITI